MLDNLQGLQLASPVRKNIMNRVAGSQGCRQLADLLLECVRGFIQAEFKLRGQDFDDPAERRREFKKDMGGSCYLYSNI